MRTSPKVQRLIAVSTLAAAVHHRARGGDGLFPQKGQPAFGPNAYVTFALPTR
ncbi:MAG: hypothetical protein ABIT16_08875 [Croceibacterium sp.]